MKFANKTEWKESLRVGRNREKTPVALNDVDTVSLWLVTARRGIVGYPFVSHGVIKTVEG